MAAPDGGNEEGGVVLTPEQKRRRRARNLALAAVLGALVVLFWVIAIVRFGGTLGPTH